MSNTKKYFLTLIPLLVFFDYLSKNWMIENIFLPEKTIKINQFLNLTPVLNKGISFGMFSSIEDINFFMIIVTITIVLFLFLWFFKTNSIFQRLSFILIISGALGNLLDRFKYQAVVDFVDIHVYELHWPAFNLADSLITIGALIYLIGIFSSENNKYV